MDFVKKKQYQLHFGSSSQQFLETEEKHGSNRVQLSRVKIFPPLVLVMKEEFRYEAQSSADPNDGIRLLIETRDIVAQLFPILLLIDPTFLYPSFLFNDNPLRPS